MPNTSAFAPLIQSLCDPAAWPFPVDTVERIETHISWVLLAGDYAYKIKKPVDFGFLDFSTLERRHHFCEEEVRINQRLAPSIYLGVVPIAGQPPRLEGEGAPVDYAVKMRRFPPDALLSQRSDALTPALMEHLAEQLVRFHQTAAVAPPESPWGEPAQVVQPMRENFAPIRAALAGERPLARLQELEAWTLRRYGESKRLLAARKRGGWIREGHGDLHLGNITLAAEGPLLFDAIEFNPELRWIDTQNDLAFLLMDLEEKGHPHLASHLLDRYLEASGDYEGVPLLPFYQCYRALVRAKVAALRLGQGDLTGEERGVRQRELTAYLDLAAGYTRPRGARLIITHGASGSGKSRAAANLARELPALRIRSDVERKRLAGLAPQARTRSAAGEGIYSRDATRATYGRLLHLAELILEGGHSLVVDATFLRREQRRPFRELAACLGVPFAILEMQTPEALMRRRIRGRLAKDRDPSEADETILDRQLAEAEPLDDAERAMAVALTPDAPLPLERLRRP